MYGVLVFDLKNKGGNIMFGLGPWEIGLFVLLVLMIFGAGKLPKIMGQIGEGMKTLRDSITYDPKNKQ